MINKIIEIGNPNCIHCPKEISIPYVFCIKPAKTKLGGVPIKVAIPPIEAA